MHSQVINELISEIRRKYGDVEYYGSSADETHGVCFKLNEINATFSIHTQDGSLKELYDIQIEGIPPGEYIYTDVVSLPELIALIPRYQSEVDQWP
jgi:hypothetical protein